FGPDRSAAGAGPGGVRAGGAEQPRAAGEGGGERQARADRTAPLARIPPGGVRRPFVALGWGIGGAGFGPFDGTGNGRLSAAASRDPEPRPPASPPAPAPSAARRSSGPAPAADRARR